MKLIKELTEEVQILTEDAPEGGKAMYIQGIFLQSGIRNRNGRMYPEAIMENEVNRYTKEKISTGRAYGELGHPDTYAVNPDRISHRIISLQREGKNYLGKALIHTTPMGNIARTIMAEGGKLAVSSRGLGSLREVNGMNEVQKDFMLTTAADIVIDPSAPDAFVDGILESKEWIWENGMLKECVIAGYQQELKKATHVNKEAVAVNLFEHFLKGLKNV